MSVSITIAIPYHSGLAYLEQALASVLAQDDPEWKLLVVDDSGGDAEVRSLVEGLAEQPFDGGVGRDVVGLRRLGVVGRHVAVQPAAVEGEDLRLPSRVGEVLLAAPGADPARVELAVAVGGTGGVRRQEDGKQEYWNCAHRPNLPQVTEFHRSRCPAGGPPATPR